MPVPKIPLTRISIVQDTYLPPNDCHKYLTIAKLIISLWHAARQYASEALAELKKNIWTLNTDVPNYKILW